MKKTTILGNLQAGSFVLVLVLSFLLVSCQKEETDGEALKCTVVVKEGSDDNVIGKWKLVIAETTFFKPRKEDYSCREVFYTFREDGKLVITSNHENLIGYDVGEYAFEFDKIEHEETQYHSLKIGNGNIGCSIENNHMILDNSPLDGPKLLLMRVE